MPLGAHLPTSKGLAAALEHAQSLDCTCLQIFSKSPKMWNAAPLDAQKCADFRALWQTSKLSPLIVHDSYLINLAASDETVRAKSARAMIDEIERADLLGADWLVTHCGAHLGKVDRSENRAPITPDEAAGLERFARNLNEVFAQTNGARVRVAIENTAAQGTCLGGPFEHLKYLQMALPGERIGFCFDTCHAFAAGHDLRTPEAVAQTLRRWDEIVGLDKIAVVHLNDSKGELGKRLDRHAHLGSGEIGRDGLRAILTHSKLTDTPFVLETPETETMIDTNLKTARELKLPVSVLNSTVSV